VREWNPSGAEGRERNPSLKATRRLSDEPSSPPQHAPEVTLELAPEPVPELGSDDDNAQDEPVGAGAAGMIRPPLCDPARMPVIERRSGSDRELTQRPRPRARSRARSAARIWALTARTRASALHRIQGSPIALGVAGRAAGFHETRWPCLRCSRLRSATAPRMSPASTQSVATGSATHVGPHSGGLAASRRTEARVRPVTKIQHVKTAMAQGGEAVEERAKAIVSDSQHGSIRKERARLRQWTW
jgi:hypothetical protein